MRSEMTAADAIRKVSLDRLAWARWLTDTLLTPMTDAQVVHRAGGTGNHALWVMGHIADADEFFRSRLTGTPYRLDERFKRLFGGKSEIEADSSVYPSRSVMVDAMRTARADLIEWWSGLSDAELERPLDGGLERFAPDVRTLAVTIAMHEMVHTGQIASCRSSLGLPRVLR